MRVHREDALSVAEIASRLLLSSWPRPCLDFSPDYLRWHFRFPASLPSVAVLAYEGNTPIGFGGLSPRQVRFRKTTRTVYLLSFVAVEPQRRGNGVGAALYKALFEAAPADIPIIVFTLVNSPGERLLTRACAAAGLSLHPLGQYPLHGYTLVDDREDILMPAASEATVDDFVLVANACQDEQMLWCDVNPEIVEHWLAHPWPHTLLVSRDLAGRAASAGVVMRAQTLEASGGRAVSSLDRLFLARPDMTLLAPLVRGAARRWNSGDPELVLLPSMPLLEPAPLRREGLRQARTIFNGHLVSRDPSDPLFGTMRTNLRID